MIKQKLFFVLIFTIILTKSHAQDTINQVDRNGKRHGYWSKNYYQTDQKRYEGTFKHGKEIDTFKYYRLNKGISVLSAIKVFNETDSISDVVFYASNKKIISQGKMNGKRFIGRWVFYHKNSDQIMTIEHYNAEGLLDGKKSIFFENGSLAEESYYVNGELDGIYKWYAKDGTLLKSSQYKKGKLNGLTKNYNALGKLVSEGHYKNDSKSGIWNYYENGKLKKEIDHTNQKVIKRYD
jgi:antitoxin component YwqK of YwqJK toxin-antitoxin module